MRELVDPAAYELKGREQVQACGLLMGRVSYEEFSPVWPSMIEEFPQYNAMHKYVVSTTFEGATAPWGEDTVTVLRSLDEVAALKQEDGGPISVHGSATLAYGLAASSATARSSGSRSRSPRCTATA